MAMVIAKGSGFLKKAGLITIAILLVAVGVIWYYKKSIQEEVQPQNKEKGTLVMEVRSNPK